MKKYLITLMLAVIATAASSKDIKTLVVTTSPRMNCENCENKIKENLRFEKGIKKIETDREKQLVTITYDADKNSAGNIRQAFQKIGYTATEPNVQPAAKTCEKDCMKCEKKQEDCQKACCMEGEKQPSQKENCCEEKKECHKGEKECHKEKKD